MAATGIAAIKTSVFRLAEELVADPHFDAILERIIWTAIARDHAVMGFTDPQIADVRAEWMPPSPDRPKHLAVTVAVEMVLPGLGPRPMA